MINDTTRGSTKEELVIRAIEKQIIDEVGIDVDAIKRDQEREQEMKAEVEFKASRAQMRAERKQQMREWRQR